MRAEDWQKTLFQARPNLLLTRWPLAARLLSTPQSGMSWEALRENLGHVSVKTTEDYVEHDVDWRERAPNWTIVI